MPLLDSQFLQEGLFMYVDGENVDQDISPTVRAPELVSLSSESFFFFFLAAAARENTFAYTVVTLILISGVFFFLQIDTNHNNEFVIGRGNDDASRGREDHKVTMDQFSFWSAFKTGQDIKEIGTALSHGFVCFQQQIPIKYSISHRQTDRQIMSLGCFDFLMTRGCKIKHGTKTPE